EKVVERLLLDRIDAKAGGAAVRGEQDLVVLARAHEAQAALAFVQLAVARAQVALETAVLQSMPVAARHALDDRLIHVQAGVNSGRDIISAYVGSGRGRGNGGESFATHENPAAGGGGPVLCRTFRPPADDGFGIARRGRTIGQRASQGADCAACGLRLFGPRPAP